VTVIVEGKKYRALGQDCQAVSEVIGQVLMVAVVVLAFSSIALTVFSDGGAMNPPHTPHTDLHENINTSTDTVQIYHSGGEAVDLEAIEVILSVNGQQAEFNMSDPRVEVRDPDGNISTDGVLMLGDYIVINTTGSVLNMTAGDAIDMYFVHAPSQQVIQKAVLQRGYGDLPYWITPHPYGSVYDKSGNDKGEWIPTELVDGINDGLMTECKMEKNLQSSETFTFGIDANEMGIKNPLTKVLLKIVYITHDNSQKDMKLEINDGNPNSWEVVDLDMDMYKDIIKCDQEGGLYNLTDNVTTIEELENLSIRVSATGIANSDNKIAWVDFLGIHVEY
jgi:FlaG/FlaF family flagellin (archaellin)